MDSGDFVAVYTPRFGSCFVRVGSGRRVRRVAYTRRGCSCLHCAPRICPHTVGCIVLRPWEAAPVEGGEWQHLLPLDTRNLGAVGLVAGILGAVVTVARMGQ